PHSRAGAVGMAQGRSRPPAEPGRQTRQSAAAEGRQPARGSCPADGAALSDLCRGRLHRRILRRSARDDARPRDRGPVLRCGAERATRGCPMNASRSLTVALGDRSYDILIGGGLIAEAGALLKERLAVRRVVTVADETVAGLHLRPLEASLEAAGITHRSVTL